MGSVTHWGSGVEFIVMKTGMNHRNRFNLIANLLFYCDEAVL